MKKSIHRTVRQLRGFIILGIAFFGLALLTPMSAAWQAEQIAFAEAPAATNAPVITVDLTQTRGKIDARAFGFIMGNKGHGGNEQTYFYRSPAGNQDLRNLGARTLYYWVDRDNWQNPYDPYSLQPALPSTVIYTDEFLALNNTLGTDPIISVNITTLCALKNGQPACEMATANHAKQWLAYIKATGIRNVNNVMLGVEPYAGCPYWSHPDGVNCKTAKGEYKIQLTQEEYAKRAEEWAAALRKVNPKIKLGLQVQPGTFLCKQDCKRVSWDETVLKRVGSKIDFLVTHQYFTINQAADTEAIGQKFSYYQEQSDIRIKTNGVTAMPKQIRKELLKWLPSKKNMPIITGEFNVARIDNADSQTTLNARMSLYAGMSLAEGYLDSLSPVNYKGVIYPGVSRVILLDLYTAPVMLAQFLPFENPTTLVKAPAWYFMSALQELQGKFWAVAKIKNNVNTAVGRPALRAYAVKKGKNVWLVVFNHNTTTPMTANIKLVGAKPVGATITDIGGTAASFLTQNTSDNPNAIAPSVTSLPLSQVKNDTLSAITFPPHSMSVIKIQGK